MIVLCFFNKSWAVFSCNGCKIVSLSCEGCRFRLHAFLQTGDQTICDKSGGLCEPGRLLLGTGSEPGPAWTAICAWLCSLPLLLSTQRATGRTPALWPRLALQTGADYFIQLENNKGRWGTGAPSERRGVGCLHRWSGQLFPLAPTITRMGHRTGANWLYSFEQVLQRINKLSTVSFRPPHKSHTMVHCERSAGLQAQLHKRFMNITNHRK